MATCKKCSLQITLTDNGSWLGAERGWLCPQGGSHHPADIDLRDTAVHKMVHTGDFAVIPKPMEVQGFIVCSKEIGAWNTGVFLSLNEATRAIFGSEDIEEIRRVTVQIHEVVGK